ncbi:MAG: HAD family phosphatase [Lachnospiraceae bacterium]|nr:HAD family phosphatase [Lachnospiraceae bacterium]
MKKLDVRAYKGVVFDLDGTLIDSMGMWQEIDREYLARFGLKAPENLQKEVNGLPFTEVAVYFKERFGIRDSLEQIGEDWREMARQKYVNSVPLKRGVRELLFFLKEEGIPTAIASSNHAELIESILRRHGVRELIGPIVTCDDAGAGKPEPAVYLAAARKLGLPPSCCLVFEDVPAGVLAGRRAGMDVCAVRDPDFLRESEEAERLADFAIDDFFPCIPL